MIILKPSRSHWIAEPATKILPSSAYSTLPSMPPSNCRYQSVFGSNRFFARIHQHETAGSVGVLGHTFVSMPGRTGSLLVTGHSGYRNFLAKKVNQDLFWHKFQKKDALQEASISALSRIEQFFIPLKSYGYYTSWCGKRWNSPLHGLFRRTISISAKYRWFRKGACLVPPFPVPLPHYPESILLSFRRNMRQFTDRFSLLQIGIAFFF